MPKTSPINFSISDNPYFARQRKQIRLNLCGADGTLLYPTLKKFKDTGRKTEEQMDEFLKTMIKPSKINIDGLKQIINCVKIQDDAIRGESLKSKLDCLSALKKAGIKRIIDIRYPDPEYDSICQKKGLEYNGFKVTDIYSKDVLIPLISTINKGDFYIGCTYGTHDTDIALMFSNFFNPKDKQFSPAKVNRMYYGFNLAQMRNIGKKLTLKDKQAIGWTPEFEKKFHERIERELELVKKERS